MQSSGAVTLAMAAQADGVSFPATGWKVVEKVTLPAPGGVPGTMYQHDGSG